jgi:hypothetical protein
MLNRRDAERLGKGIIRLLILGVFVLLTFSQIKAQEPSPQIVDSTSIFAPAVEVTETLPVLTYNNFSRNLWYFDPLKTEWTAYPYPADLDKIQDYKLRSNGTYLLSNEYYKGIAGAIWEKVWVFDPKDGSIKRAEAVCSLVKALPSEGKWLFTQLPKDGQYRLCNNETGEQTKPLPAEIQAKIQRVCTSDSSFSNGLPLFSPDKKWIAFNTCDPTTAPPYHSIYGYNLATEKINDLGGELGNYFELTKWIDNQHILVREGYFFTGGDHNIHIADVEKPLSLDQISSQYAFEPTILDNPPRILWITSEFPDPNDNNKVVKLINEYDISSQTSSVIARHPCDSITCESGYVVWADDKIAVFINGYPLNIDYQGVTRDLKADKELYSTRTRNIITLDNSNFIFIVFDSTIHSCVLQLVNIQDGKVDQFELPDSAIDCTGNAFRSDNAALSPTKQNLLVVDQTYDTHSVAVYSLANQKRYPVVDNLSDEYTLSAKWHDENLIQVDLVKKEENCGYYACVIGSWLVRVNEEKSSQ